MTKVVSVNSDKMLIKSFMNWIEGDESALLVRWNGSEDVTVRYPYSESLPQVEGIASMGVKTQNNVESNGTWQRNGYWFKKQKLFLCRQANEYTKPYKNIISYGDMLHAMKKAFLEDVWEKYSKLFPTLESMKDLGFDMLILREPYITEQTDMAWLTGKLPMNPKDIFMEKTPCYSFFLLFDEKNLIEWLANNKEKIPEGITKNLKTHYALMDVNDKSLVVNFLGNLKMAYLMVEKARNYTPSSKVVASKKIADAMVEYKENHYMGKTVTVVWDNSKGETQKERMAVDDLLLPDEVYLHLNPDDEDITADQVKYIKFGKDYIYQKA